MTRRIVRTPLCRALACAALLAAPAPAAAQQSFVSLVGAVQFATGDQLRLGGQQSVEPDFGIQVFDSSFASGKLRADLNVTRRNDTAVLGRSMVALDDVKAAGLSWSLGAGDVWATAAVPSFGFSNLFAPPVTLVGARVTAVNRNTSLDVSGGRVTALRNLYGTDSYPIGQNVYQASLTHRASPRMDLHARGSYVQGAAAQPYTTLTDKAFSVGAGGRYRAMPSLELVADAGYTKARRRGATSLEAAPSGIIGAHLIVARGWLQVNAQRLPVGTYPVFNYPYKDRRGVFALGEYELTSAFRLFGSLEFTRTDVSLVAAEESAAGVPPGSQARGYAGARVRVGDRSTVSVRAEGGGRDIQPSLYGPGFVSDTTVFSGEWQSRIDRGNLFLRYERRNTADLLKPEQGYLQHDAMAQVYFGLAAGAQGFVQGMFSGRTDGSGTGQTLWQVSGGTQFSYRRNYLRVEANTSRTAERLTGRMLDRQGLSAGLSSQIGRDTYFSLDCYVDRTPLEEVSSNPWVTRLMVRLSKSFPFGARSTTTAVGTTLSARGPSGRVDGVVFTDWNENGRLDPGEEPIEDVAVSLVTLGNASTAADGRFEFISVPVGKRDVAIDLSTLPAAFDPPAEALRTVEVGKNAATHLVFGLLPLGGIEGVVVHDTDGNGRLSGRDTPLNDAVAVLDDGLRTEVSREGTLRFEAIRYGTHTVTLLVPSLPDGTALITPLTVEVTLARGAEEPRFVFLVKSDTRPEIRKVFPLRPAFRKPIASARGTAAGKRGEPGVPAASAAPNPPPSLALSAAPSKRRAASPTSGTKSSSTSR